MGAKKYTEQTLDELLNIAINQKLITQEDINNYANQLFDVVQFGCWENIKHEVVQCETLKGKAYEDTMKVLNRMYEKVKKDTDSFKSKTIEVKLKAFRIANFLDVEPEKYLGYEDKIKEIIGKERINTGKELTMRLNKDEMKEYALLTSPVRKRFEKTFDSEILIIRNQIEQAEKLAIEQNNTVQDKPKKTNRFKL